MHSKVCYFNFNYYKSFFYKFVSYTQNGPKYAWRSIQFNELDPNKNFETWMGKLKAQVENIFEFKFE